jgi:hypothetical protein
MSYQNRLSKLSSTISRIQNEEYNVWKLMETRTVRELLDRIQCRIRNSFNCEVLHEEEYKQ